MLEVGGSCGPSILSRQLCHDGHLPTRTPGNLLEEGGIAAQNQVSEGHFTLREVSLYQVGKRVDGKPVYPLHTACVCLVDGGGIGRVQSP